jgi:AraC-like DNA-binding protein
MLLKFNKHFSHPELPVQLFLTNCSHFLDWHSHEFSEIAIMLEGECIYETDFSSSIISQGDVVVIPPGGKHRYKDEKNVWLMNILFHIDKLTFPYLDIVGNSCFASLFRIKSNYCKQMKFYPSFKLNNQELEDVNNILRRAYKLQEEKLPGATLGVYGAFLLVIPILLKAYSQNSIPQKNLAPSLITKAINIMHSSYKNNLTIPQLAKDIGMSESSFFRHFKAATGIAPVEYLLKLKLEDAAKAISGGKAISEAAFEAGFNDSNYFSRIFKKKYGISPRNFAK